MTPCPDAIRQLVDKFERNRAQYLRPEYNETQARREFIDPFFQALGWDVDNSGGVSPAYQEVIHEDTLHLRGGQVRSPDYCFRLGTQRMFYVEAKKPSVDVGHSVNPAYQLRRYGWTAKLPLSVLTDFHEFAIYDCLSYRPAPSDSAATARVLYLHYREYPERWDEIAAILSREGVWRGDYDRYAQDARGKRGTQEVDAAFLLEIERWRLTLARNIALRNPGLGVRELNYAVQLTIDRLIFLRICEDREIEPYGQLQALLDGGDSYIRLLDLFRRADARYNSGLFHLVPEAGRDTDLDTITPTLMLDDRAIKEIVGSLYYPDCPYEFSVLGVDILGTVYEQFLGNVIRLTPAHHAVVEQKPEVRKAGGVFYTPDYIVDYIVRHTLGPLVAGQTPAGLRGQSAARSTPLRILDPACGSGSFLLGAYQFLLDWYLTYYMEHPTARGAHNAVYPGRRGQMLLTTEEKKRILLDHIFGVDIDPQAVEVTKLSLLLQVLEDENSANVQQLALLRERALPDLGPSIQCGNSLISPEFYKGQLLLDSEEAYRINVFDWQAAFPEIIAGGGFDAVIGNPPYVRQEGLGEFKPYFQRTYRVYHGVADLYAYFIERGISLLRPGGLFGYIVANKWLRANYGQPLRRWLKEQGLIEIVDFGDLPVFKTATTYPCILRVQCGRPPDSLQVTDVDTLVFDSLTHYVAEHQHTVLRAHLDDGGWSLLPAEVQALLDKLKRTGVPLGQFVGGRIYYGIKTGLNAAFVIDGETRARLIAEDARSAELIVPFLRGRDVKRYQPPEAQCYLIFTRRGVRIDQYPAIKRHLTQYKTQLMPKPKAWKGERWPGRKPGPYEWYEIQDTVAYWKEFAKPKIVVPAIVAKASYALDASGCYSNDKTSIIAVDDLYLLGLLNGRVLDMYIHVIASTKQGGYHEYKPMYVTQLPIRTIDPSNPADVAQHDRMVALVEGMLRLHREVAAARAPAVKTALQRQIAATDREIDRLVYALYDLTPDEIAIVEGGG